jgi:hypothetical protein
MDQREEHIERMKQSIAEAKQLKSELTQNIADLRRILRRVKARVSKKPKSKIQINIGRTMCSTGDANKAIWTESGSSKIQSFCPSCAH